MSSVRNRSLFNYKVLPKDYIKWTHVGSDEPIVLFDLRATSLRAFYQLTQCEVFYLSR